MAMEQGLDFKDLDRRMHGALSVLRTELSGLRTGRASPNLLDPVMVNAYGQHMPINQVATINVPEPRMLSVQVWDKSVATKRKAKTAARRKPIKKAIKEKQK